MAWFAGMGILNGGAVLLLYAALAIAPVWTVAPIVAAYPPITGLVGVVFLPDERLSPRVLAGTGITVGAVVYLATAHG
jgi:drug/metabolite transporter (DMT)-like permease